MEFPGFATCRLVVGRQDGADIHLAYVDNQRQGGPALLLLHGIFDNKATWFYLGQHLKDHYRFIAPDLLGHGFSSKPLFADQPPSCRYTIDAQVAFLRTFIARLGLGELVLVGNSLGGGLALRLYLQCPELAEKVRGLVLIDAAGYPQELPGHVRQLGGWQGGLLARPLVGFLARHLGLLRLSVRRTFRRCFHDLAKIPPALVAEALAALNTPNALYAYQHAARNILPPDYQTFHERFRTISCPALILWGKEDRILHPLSALLFKAELPRAELHLFDCCGHAPHLEYPAQVAQLISGWMSRHC
jgi:4,5:9,10-diseco-3-hydroxy-5,9,17-trioxoandrosta-1(10),2-diene-4-oate hydrolase